MKRTNRIWPIALLTLMLSACHETQPENDRLVLIQIQDRNGLSETISSPDRLNTYNNVDFLSSQPYKKVLRVYRNDGKNSSVITTYHPNGTTWQMLEAKEMRAFGAYLEWFPSGIKKIEATVIGGSADLTLGVESSWLFDGKSRVWNEDGHLMTEILYDKGVLSGPSIYYYSSGAKEKEIPYVQDQIHGTLQEFFETGELRLSAEYKNGKKDGFSRAYWKDNSLCYQEEYLQDRLINGEYWSPSREKISEVKEGIGFRAAFLQEALSELQEVQNGVIEGVITTFDKAHVLTSQYHVKNGQKQGEETEYDPYYSSFPVKNGQNHPKITLDWDHGAIHGLVKTWYPNGQMQSQREMCHNKRNGPYCCWYRDGSLMLMEEYENDTLINGQYFQKNHNEPISTISNGSGIATIYDEDGVFVRKVEYSKGKILDP